jgi:3-isopropylmalate dehydrogenase
MDLHILVLPGDGIGTEVTREAVRVLRHVAAKWNHKLSLTEGLLGGVAIHRTGTPFPDETAKLAAEADATLMGAVGLPEFARHWEFTPTCVPCGRTSRSLILRP